MRRCLHHLFLRTCGVSLIVFTTVHLSACGDGSDSPEALRGEYAGAWDVRFNVLDDGGQVVEPGLIGFVDRQLIDQSGNEIVLQGNLGITEPLTGTVDENFRFKAVNIFEGDFYQDGSFCYVEQSVSYDPRTNDSAEALYLRFISCDLGFECSTTAVGEAVRRDD